MPDYQVTLAAARVNRHMSQKEAAEKLGISRELLIKIESGKREPKPYELLAFSQLYQVPMELLSISQ